MLPNVTPVTINTSLVVVMTPNVFGFHKTYIDQINLMYRFSFHRNGKPIHVSFQYLNNIT